VAVCGFVLFGSFGGNDDTTQGTALPSLSDNDVPPPPTVALPTPGKTTGVVTPTELPTPTPSEIVSASSFHNCAQVRAAGKAPLHRGDPGYSRKLDKNGDGIACDHGNS
jgi:hypothetical protein